MGRIVMIALVASAILLQGAYAQQIQVPPARSQPKVMPHQKMPREYTAKDLDMLFKALEAAPDTDSGKFVAEKIMRIWATSKSDTVNLLMNRAVLALQQAKNIDVSIELLSAIIKINPEYFEARGRRGALYFQKGDMNSAMKDIRRVLAVEPRHFQVLVGLGNILQQVGEDKKALAVFRRVLQIYPQVEKIPEIVKTLEEKVEGRGI